MTSTRLDQLSVDESIGNGNCAFNSIVLGLSLRAIMEYIEEELRAGADFHEFIKLASKAFQVRQNWSEIKARIFELRNSDKNQLQLLLSPVMRHLAISLAEKDRLHFDRTKEPLTSAFRDYAHKRLGLPVPGVADDIYSRHPFIVNQFDTLFTALRHEIKDQHIKVSPDNKQRIDAMIAILQEQLVQWWGVSGYEKFLHAMKFDGQWAGDLELSQLATYFKINLDVVRRNFIYHIHDNTGTLPIADEVQDYVLSEDEIVQLRDRSVVNRRENGESELRLLPLFNLAELKARVTQVPEFEKVSAHVQSVPDLLGSPVPADWSSECIRELKKRSIVEKTDTGAKFVVEQGVAVKRVCGMDKAEKIASAWQAGYKTSPTITLANERGIHWNNTKTKAQAAKDAAVVKSASDSELCAVSKSFVAFKEQTLRHLAIGTIQPRESKWKALIEEAKKQKDLSGTAVEYAVADGEKIKVNQATQIELDAELAAKLQHEEYQLYLRPRKR
jgi:hypothetical protein